MIVWISFVFEWTRLLIELTLLWMFMLVSLRVLYWLLWHIKGSKYWKMNVGKAFGDWTLPSSIQYAMLCNAQNTKNFCEAKIISKISIYGIPTACYDGLWCNAKRSPIVCHKFWFCIDDLIRCVGFHSRKYVVDRPIIQSIWLVQLATMFM